MRRASTWTLAIACLAASTGLAEAAKYQPNWESLDQRPVPKWFNEAKFGIFVVWGPYSVPAWAPKGRYAEWYGNHMRRKNSPTAKFHAKVYGADFKYEQFAPKFTAEMWDPHQWADLFAQSGARYVVCTANYHDGYCLFPSPYRKGWNSVDVGPKRDLLGELGRSVRAKGMKMGIYYSLYEWYHPLWLKDRARFVTEHFHPQFKYVVTNYKPSFIFADGEWSMDYKAWRSEELLAWLFNDSPCRDEVVVNDRWGKCRRVHGTVFSSEYGGGEFPPTHPWQEDRGMGRSYGYNRNETVREYNTRTQLLHMLTKCAGNGGNLLLCVGPTADGRIPVIMQERLAQIGRWLKVNGEAVYGTKASPFWPRKFAWGTCTVKGSKIFLHVYGRPKGEIELPGLTNKVTACYSLGDAEKKPIATRPKEGRLTIPLPEHPPGEAVNVIVLEVAGKVAVDLTIRQQGDGSVALLARDATIHGRTPRYESGGGKDNIGHWSNPKDSVSWTFQLTSPGDFRTWITYSCEAGFGGSEFVVAVGERKLVGRSKETGAWNNFAPERLGTIKLDKPGKYTLRVQPRAKPKWKAIGLQSIVLKPAN